MPPTLPPDDSSLHDDEKCWRTKPQSQNQASRANYAAGLSDTWGLPTGGPSHSGDLRWHAYFGASPTITQVRMGLLSILKKVKQKEKEVRLLIL